MEWGCRNRHLKGARIGQALTGFEAGQVVAESIGYGLHGLSAGPLTEHYSRHLRRRRPRQGIEAAETAVRVPLRAPAGQAHRLNKSRTGCGTPHKTHDGRLIDDHAARVRSFARRRPHKEEAKRE